MFEKLDTLEIRKAWTRLLRAAPQAPGGTGAHVAVAGTFTVDPIAPYVGLGLVNLGCPTPAISIGPYDQLFQICHDWRAALPADTDTIVLLWRIEDLLRPELQAALRGAPDALEAALAKVDQLASAVAGLRQDFGGALVVSNVMFPHGPDHDSHMLLSHATAGRFHRAVADRWAQRMAETAHVQTLDLEALQRIVGIVHALDDRKWYLYRQPFTEAFWAEIGAALAKLIAARTLAPKKCLIVDCDNTLWGGIVGEDGVEGIKLGDDYPGSAFRDFQHLLLTLKSQGVMLAICSKNNEADVWEVFDRHDGMVVRRDDFVAHRINWTDKPSNIAEIATELNIGLDSLVFIDDSPMEIAQVQAALPQVTCLAVPSDAARLPASLAAFRLFDRDRVTDEDRDRSAMMLQQRDRRAVACNASPEDFIRALELNVDVAEAQPEHLARVAQLGAKTNQFNLTTPRRSVEEVAALAAAPDWIVLALRASDRFGDYGLVGAAFIQVQAAVAVVDTLFMSCRVLGRKVEDSFLAAIAEAAQARGATILRGRYLPTPKNGMVADFYRERGFEPQADGYWHIPVGRVAPWPAQVKGGLQLRDVAEIP